MDDDLRLTIGGGLLGASLMERLLSITRPIIYEGPMDPTILGAYALMGYSLGASFTTSLTPNGREPTSLERLLGDDPQTKRDVHCIAPLIFGLVLMASVAEKYHLF